MSLNSLPIDLDVVVSLSMAQTEIATDMTLMCILTPHAAPITTNRVQFFSTYASALATTTPGSSLDYALQAFFAQEPRPNTIAIGQYDAATTDLVAEAVLVQTAAINAGKPIYGWTLDRSMRDDTHQSLFANWVNAQKFGVTCLCTNDADAYNPIDTANVAYVASHNALDSVAVIYHDNALYYPDVAYMARLLAVNYGNANSVITMKFKDLPGIPTVVVSESQMAALEARRCNTFAAMGNNARTVRDGMNGAPNWFSDMRVNFDNYINELQVAVFNVFLRTPKVPYTAQGQNMLITAAAEISDKYVINGTFAPRDVPQIGTDKFLTLPAYKINPAPVGGATASNRAARIAPPIQITAYDSGAMHMVTINIDVQQ